MKLYHRTSATAATSILVEGFRDGDYEIEDLDGDLRGGVWLATSPFDAASLGQSKTEVILTQPIRGQTSESTKAGTVPATS